LVASTGVFTAAVFNGVLGTASGVNGERGPAPARTAALQAPVNCKVLCYCFVAVKGTGVTVVPVMVFPSAETVTL